MMGVLNFKLKDLGGRESIYVTAANMSNLNTIVNRSENQIPSELQSESKVSECGDT